MSNLPTGTVTFLFTDIEGSTKIAQQYPDTWELMRERHHALLRAAIEAHSGHVFQIVGDAFCAAFATASDGLAAALAAQHQLRAEAWGEFSVNVRMGLHTGAAERHDGDYRGYLTLACAQRVMSTARGGQILLSSASAALLRGHLPADITLRDMGAQRLKGFSNPERLWQLVAPDLPTDFPALPTFNAIPNNLPLQLNSFVGREKELAEVKQYLTPAPDEQHRHARGQGGDVRLLTLTGSGGTGKTRLSLQTASEVMDTFKDGVWLVELATLADPALVPQTVASVLDVPAERNRPLLATLTDYLRAKNVLLILDNCEHLVAACADLADALLRACPTLRILASSREALGIAGETSYRVPSLSMPPLHAPPTNLAALLDYDAVRLFIDRAVAAKSDFRVTTANAPAVAQICQRLDGIPLALELAAARVKVLKVEQIAARLDDRFRLLTGGSRTVLPRQQTLRALIDWSYDLLSAAERILLLRLSVFAGGWTLEAAEAVCAEEQGSKGAEEQRGEGADVTSPLLARTLAPLRRDDVLDLLTHLVDKSLVVMEDNGDADAARYRFLETIRQFARDKLLDAGEGERVRDRHLSYYAAFVAEAEQKLQGVERVVWLKRLEAERDNCRVALEWALTRDPQAALRIAADLGIFFWNEHAVEGIAWLRQAFAHVDALPPAAGEAARVRMQVRAKGFTVLSDLNNLTGDQHTARAAAAEAGRLYRSIGDEVGAAHALVSEGISTVFSAEPLAGIRLLQEAVALLRAHGQSWALAQALTFLAQIVARVQHDYAAARAYLEEALRLRDQLGDDVGKAMSAMGLGVVALLQRDYALARTQFQQSLTWTNNIGTKRFANLPRSGLAEVARLTGDHAQAIALYQEAIAVWSEAGNRGGIARCMECLAFIAGKQAQAQRAVTLLGAAAAIRDASGATMAPDERIEYEAELEHMRAQIDETMFKAAWNEGNALSTEQAIALALGHTGG